MDGQDYVLTIKGSPHAEYTDGKMVPHILITGKEGQNE